MSSLAWSIQMLKVTMLGVLTAACAYHLWHKENRHIMHHVYGSTSFQVHRTFVIMCRAAWLVCRAVTL